jgi:hypothetical protein
LLAGREVETTAQQTERIQHLASVLQAIEHALASYQSESSLHLPNTGGEFRNLIYRLNYFLRRFSQQSAHLVYLQRVHDEVLRYLSNPTTWTPGGTIVDEIAFLTSFGYRSNEISSSEDRSRELEE